MRRGQVEIWADILSAIDVERRRHGRVRPTRVRMAANLPHDRFLHHLARLHDRGWVDAEALTITEEGQAFLQMARPLCDRMSEGEGDRGLPVDVPEA